MALINSSCFILAVYCIIGTPLQNCSHTFSLLPDRFYSLALVYMSSSFQQNRDMTKLVKYLMEGKKAKVLLGTVKGYLQTQKEN